MGISTDFSVAIAGAGLSGLCLAQYLVRAGIDVHVYERDPGPFVRRQGYRLILDRYGLEALRESLPEPLYQLALSTSDEPGGHLRFTDSRLRDAFTINFNFKDEPHVTRQVDRLTLRSILQSGLEGRIHYGKAAVGIDTAGPGGLRLRFADGGAAEATVVVGADGIGSALRAQVMPAAEPAQTPMAGVYGRSPLRQDGRSVIPEPLRTSGVLAIADEPGRAFFFTSMRFGESPPEAFARLAPGTYAPSGDDYVMWGLLLRREEVPAGVRGDLLALQQLAVRKSADFHPLIRRLVDTAELDATVLNLFATGRRPHRWAVPRATMMGDAVHAMPPFGAHGGNTALRDAALLGHKLVEALVNGTPVEEAIAAYQNEMVPYAFGAVDNAARLMRRLTGSAAAPHWVLTRVLPRLHRVTVPEGMIAGMSDEPARASAISALMRAGRETSRLSMVFRYAIAERLGLTVSDLECLDYLTDVGSATAGQVAERTNLTTGAVTSMLRRLQQAGYVTAERDPADRRRMIVTLRPERIAELERPYERFAERAERLVEGYSVEEVMLLIRHHDHLQAMYLAELDHLRGGRTAQRSA